MLRMRVASENTKRLLVLLLVIGLVLVLAGVAEFRHRQVDLRELDRRAALILAINMLPAILWNSLPAFIALAVIPWLASRFIHGLYDMRNLREAHDFLHRNVFGMSALRPIMIVREGRIAVGAGDLCDRVGGRCFIIVYNDSTVVIEKGGHLTRVVGPILGFLEPFERIWEVVDLRPQRWLFNVNGMTKEGIPVSCEADVTFKIDDRYVDRDGNVQTKPPVETKMQPFTDAAIEAAVADAGIRTPLPYTDEAVVKAATSLWVRIRQPDHDEQLRKWTGRVVIGEVEGALRSILARYRLDWLMQPPQPDQKHPREEIREQLKQKLLNALPVDNRLGARILNVDLGKIDVRDVEDEKGEKMRIPEKVHAQWIEAWQVGWEQRAVESRAEGEAELARLQAAQVQAQAEMVLTLTEAIRPLVTSAEEFPSYLLAMQFIETLRWMAYDPFKRAFLPPEIMRTLDELEKILGKVEIPADEETLTGLGRLLIGS